MTSIKVSKPIYADNAATTQLSLAAFERMQPFLVRDFGNPSQPYSLSRVPKRAIREAREIVASCINAEPDEIIFTSGGTESDNMAIKGFALRSSDRKLLVASSIEHHAVLNSCMAMKLIGHDTGYLPVSATGVIEASSLENLPITGNSLVNCMYANNEIGTVQPIKHLCCISHERGALFHTDAVQAVGHIPIDVKTLDVDMLSASAHKFHGPRGVGFLYVKKGTSIASYASGGAQEMNQRAGTENTAGIVGLAAALKESCEEMDSVARVLRNHEIALLNRLTEAGINFVRNGQDQLPGLLSLSFQGVSGEMLFHRLDLMHILVSTGSACDGSNTHISHVLEAIGLARDYANGTVRISLGRDTTSNDVELIASAIIKILTEHP